MGVQPQVRRSATAGGQDLDRSLRELRTVTAGMRGDFAGLPERIAGAAQPALAQYTQPAQQYSRSWQTEVEGWQSTVQAPRERPMAMPLTQR
ncbi:hypothetical protein [Delftia acidovorans]|uniref:hypothetical protein n=2 Tax=Delftia acidovorans TaxID=80866 RepID=UPI00359F5951